MYAVIKTGGKQYKVTEGYSLKVEKLNAEVGDKVTFDEVLLVSNDDDLKVGKPFLSGAKVVAVVEEQGKGKKIRVGKFKAKKGYKRINGHRQPFTRVKVESIEA